jgi:hypothetical protein
MNEERTLYCDLCKRYLPMEKFHVGGTVYGNICRPCAIRMFRGEADRLEGLEKGGFNGISV